MYRKNAWENLAEDEKEQLSAFAKDYMAFLNNGKTERECVAEGVRQAEAKGFKNLMDVYLNAVFCPLAMVDKAVFEQEGWHRSADGTVSGVVYNEMQGALAAPDAQLENALERAMFPDTALSLIHI